ncbi:MAG: DUF1667 domain-containing protein [Raoultibacter sp.]
MQFATEVKTYTCICCPLGCPLEVSFDQEGCVIDVAGHTCARGREYALEEATDPVRMVTAIVCVQGSLEPLSVKTEAPVPKAAIREVLAAIAALRLQAPISAGAVLIENVCETGVAVVATKDIA